MIPPYRIKVVENIKLIPEKEREKSIKNAGYNPFLIPAEDVFIDLVSDSGLSGLSTEQLSELMLGDESFAQQKGYFYFIDKIRQVFDFQYITPFHQGRAIENALSELLVKEGDCVVSNSFFETTRANIEKRGGRCVDFPDLGDEIFGGNIDIERLNDFLSKEKVRFILLTLTNNTMFGLPVSFENMYKVKEICRKKRILLIFDASRFSENCYFIWKYEFKNRRFKDVIKKVFSLPDIAYLSAKKDGLSNTGGIFMTRIKDIYDKMQNISMIKEGFISHGGLNDRDLRVIAKGIEEVIDEDYIEHRIGQVRYLIDLLLENKIPLKTRYSGHAVYIDAEKILGFSEYPGYLLSAVLYIKGGIRGGIFGGKLSMGKAPETLRLSIPRRVYSEEHLRYVSCILNEVKDIRINWDLKPYFIPEDLKTFGVRFRRVKNGNKRC